MEHNIRKLLENKINEAEHKPVDWRKVEVWHRLQTQLPARRNHLKIFYYAAAAILLAISFVGYSIFTPTIGNRIKSLEAAIAIFEKESSIASQPLTAESEIKCAAQEKIEFKTKKSSRKKTTSDLPVDSSFTVAEIQITPEVVALESSKQSDTAVAPVATRETRLLANRIEPIVGVFNQEEVTSTVSRKKKTKLHRLDIQDDKLPTETFRNSIIARIK